MHQKKPAGEDDQTHPTINIQSRNSEVLMSMDAELVQKTKIEVCLFDTHKNMHDLSCSAVMSGEASHKQLKRGDNDTHIQKIQVAVTDPHKTQQMQTLLVQ